MQVKTSDHRAVSPDNVVSLKDAVRHRNFPALSHMLTSADYSSILERAHQLTIPLPHLRLVRAETEKEDEGKEKETAALPRSRVKVGDIDVNYLEAGPADGKVLLLVHGSGNADAMGWHKNIGFFADNGYRVIAPDLPGFGDTHNPKKQKYNEQFYVEFLDNFLNSMRIEGKVSIVGASAGGFTTVMYAAAHPDRVSDIVTVGSYDPHIISAYPKPWPEILSHPRLMEYSVLMAARNERLFNFGYRVYSSLNKKMHVDFTPISSEKVQQSREEWKHMRRATFEYISGHRRQTKSYDAALAILAESDVRALLLHGGKDGLTFSEYSRHAAELLKSPFESFEDSAHALQRDNADKFNSTVLRFLEEGRKAQEEQPLQMRRHWYSRMPRRKSA